MTDKPKKWPEKAIFRPVEPGMRVLRTPEEWRQWQEDGRRKYAELRRLGLIRQPGDKRTGFNSGPAAS